MVAFLSDDPSQYANSFCLIENYPFTFRDNSKGWTIEKLLNQHGQRYLAEYVRVNPCRRPSWWWTFQAPGTRRQIGRHGNVTYFESEAAFLHRHGLLSPIEKRHLQAHPDLLKAEKEVIE
jgi:hypothetical protein